MTAVPVVPKSFTKPVPASQARSAIQEQLDASRERVERMAEASKREVVRQLVALEAELRERLVEQQRAGRGDSWTAADTEATLVQVRELLGRQGREFKGMLAANATTARRLGVKSAAAVLHHFEGKRGGPVRPLALEATAAAQNPLLARHEASVARYGARTIGRIAGVIQRGLLVGDTFSEMTDRLTGKRGAPGVLVQSAGDAARIIRTEGLFAMNAGAHEEALAQRAKRFPDLKKRICETFDSRTAPDSYSVHGQTRELEQPFADAFGHSATHPPLRPNDRAVEIVWRDAWDEG